MEMSTEANETSSSSSSKSQLNNQEPISSSNPINSQSSPPQKSTIFDLRTTRGQLIFLLISIITSSVIQQIPTEKWTQIFNNFKLNNSNELLLIKNQSSIDQINIPAKTKPIYWTYGKSKSHSHLKHVHQVLEYIGLEKGTNESDWDLLWAHDYPFRVFYPKLHQLNSHQKVNHFPGSGYLTNKVDLATTSTLIDDDNGNGLSKFIPPAFKLPDDKDKFLKYIKKNPKKLFVQKHNQHRHIYVKQINEIDFLNNETFLQEFIEHPLLVAGHKFDIGVYVTITSIDPLRVYIYTGDILFRYCPLKYYPFNATELDKYVVGDDYLPTWEIPELNRFYSKLGFGMKDSFDGYIKSLGNQLDPAIIWQQVEESIRLAILSKEHHIANLLKSFKHKRNFFEMMRFDLVIDKNLNVYLIEANMSPNLSSAHFLPNQLLYEQVIYNLLNLVGVGSTLNRQSFRKESKSKESMLSSNKNILVNSEICSNVPCIESCAPIECSLCLPCLSNDDLMDLHESYQEHMRRGDTKRIFPIAIENQSMLNENLIKMSPKNQLLIRWFEAKCNADKSWCST